MTRVLFLLGMFHILKRMRARACQTSILPWFARNRTGAFIFSVRPFKVRLRLNDPAVPIQVLPGISGAGEPIDILSV